MEAVKALASLVASVAGSSHDSSYQAFNAWAPIQAPVATISTYVSSWVAPVSWRHVTFVTFVRRDDLASWISTSRVVEIVLGGTVDGQRFEVHAELLRRFLPAMVFLASQAMLTDNHIRLLWDAAQSTDMCRRHVFKMLPDLVDGMAVRSHVDYLFQFIAAVPTSDYDDVRTQHSHSCSGCLGISHIL